MTKRASEAYVLLRQVPPGRVTTYKELAHAMGTKAYRAIGRMMRNNPYAFESCKDEDLRIPCHRVVASDGTIGGFMGKRYGENIQKKIKMLNEEGIEISNNKVHHFSDILFRFN